MTSDGAIKIPSFFWLNKRSTKQQPEDYLINREEVLDNCSKKDHDYKVNDRSTLSSMFIIFPEPRKRDSFKKKTFRRFFPWKKK